MAVSRSAPALLHVALDDLHAGKRAQAARLAALARHCTDAPLATLLAEEAARAGEQAARIRAVAPALSDQTNLWIGGILDDAERDTRQTQPGDLLDVALVGAIRKAKAAEIVSSETALALAGQVDADAIHAAIAANRADEVATDRRLKERLVALTATH